MKIERTAFGKNVAALEAKESRLSQVSKEGQAHYLDETTDFDLTLWSCIWLNAMIAWELIIIFFFLSVVGAPYRPTTI